MTPKWLQGLLGAEVREGAGTPHPAGEHRPARVLVVDDSGVARRALSLVLEGADFEVTTAESALEAHRAVEWSEPAGFDVVLMDLRLPDGSGIDTFVQIKRRPLWQDVPVIVVTSSDDDHDLALAFASGATDYIAKPPREMELLARVHAALRLRQEMTRRKAREHELEALNDRLRRQTDELAVTREALVALNGELEQRVRAQVDEIRRRADEVSALNAELRTQVRERSRELAHALQRLGRDDAGAHRVGPGTVLGGRVRLVRRLASGGMGVVYSGVDLVSGSAVAVKVLDLGARLRERDLQRFIAEASSAAAVAHPAIVRIKHVDVSDHGEPFIVMELVDGVTLDAVRGRGLSPAWCASIGHVVADALAAAHLANVIHRDIKPANLMVCRQPPGVRVLDFGISKLRATADRLTLTQTNGLLGTPAYMAPEQIEDARAVTPATDVYSLGTVLYQLIANELPFGGADLRTRLFRAWDTPPRLADRAPDAPPRLAALIDRCLATEPARRPPARELADELGDIKESLGAPPALHLLGLVTRPAAQAEAGAHQ